SIALLRPPLFLTLSLFFLLFVFNFFIAPALNIILIFSFIVFLMTFFNSLRTFQASPVVLKSMKAVPRFVFSQFLGLLNVKRANSLSVATVHSPILRTDGNTTSSITRILHVIRQ